MKSAKKDTSYLLKTLPHSLKLAEQGRRNIADFLKPHIQSGDVIIIGETNYRTLKLLERLMLVCKSTFVESKYLRPIPAIAISILTAVARELDRSEEVLN